MSPPTTSSTAPGARPTPRTPPTNPINVYGATKLAGERAVSAACARSLSIRTSWVVSAHGKNFIKTMLRLAQAGNPIKVVDDQLGRPTAAGDLAGFILGQATRIAAAPAGDPVFGVVHFANAEEVSWRGFAQAIFGQALGEAAPFVAPTTTVEYVTPAQRPIRSTMDTTKLKDVYGYTPRPWRETLPEMIGEILSGL
jgi:dTDP-4-dehydrorhamnose reductase